MFALNGYYLIPRYLNCVCGVGVTEQILAERAEGPRENEFVETYQKLKFAINLIVRRSV